MKLTGNTIFITGGGSGIGRGLAEALHKLGNKLIISGRRRANLDEVVTANPGMVAVELDITDPASIDRVAARLVAEHPDLNVLFNNAGIMLPDQAAGRIDDKLLVDTVTTNLIGPIRITAGLIEHLKHKDGAVIVYTSSVLGFVPLAATAVYSATKAALHSYAMSQRFLLKDSGVRVLEIAPPWVRTDLMNSREAKEAMPLDQRGDDGRVRHGCRRDPGGRRKGFPVQRRPERAWPCQQLQPAHVHASRERLKTGRTR